MAPFARYVISTTQAQDSAFSHQRASLTSWLVTAVDAITISIASEEVATEHSALQSIA